MSQTNLLTNSCDYNPKTCQSNCQVRGGGGKWSAVRFWGKGSERLSDCGSWGAPAPSWTYSLHQQPGHVWRRKCSEEIERAKAEATGYLLVVGVVSEWEKKRWEMSEDDEWENAPGFGVNSQHITPHPSGDITVLDPLSFIICISYNFPLATDFNSLLWWMLQLSILYWILSCSGKYLCEVTNLNFHFLCSLLQLALNLASQNSILQIKEWFSVHLTTEHKHNLCCHESPWFALWLV